MSHTWLFRTLFILITVPAVLALSVSVARSQSPLRAYVAAGKGKDINRCTLKLPCKSISRALEAISPSGTVTIIEDGNYAPFTISKAASPIFVTVEASPGVVATIGANTGAAIDIEADSQDQVVLRGLHLDTLAGFVGISCTKVRALYVESCFITNFNIGIDFQASGHLFVTNTNFKRDAGGISVKSGGDPSSAEINHCRIEDGTVGLTVDGSVDVVIRDSVIADNASFGVNCLSRVLGTANLFIENCSITGGAFLCASASGCNGGVGIFVVAIQGTAKVWLSNTTITQNRVGVDVAVNGTVFTFKNNRIAGNKEAEVKGALTEAPNR